MLIALFLKLSFFMLKVFLVLFGIFCWFMITGLIMFITLVICAVSLFIGAVGGFCMGVGKGVFNYFSALRSELQFSQD